MASIGDQITKKFILSISCPLHGEFCEALGPRTTCRARVDKAIPLWHQHLAASRVGRDFWSQFPDNGRGF